MPSGILLVCLCFLLAFTRFSTGIKLFLVCTIGGICLLLMLLTAVFNIVNQKTYERNISNIFQDNRQDTAKIAKILAFPCLLMDQTGLIVWRNDAMEKICAENNIKAVFPKFNPVLPPLAVKYEYNGTSYQLFSHKFQQTGTKKNLIFQYWVDRTEATLYQRLYEEHRPYLALIYVDNYEELSADQQFHRATVLAEVENLVSSTASSLEGIYRRYDNGRFLLIFESKHLDDLEKSKFSILETAHQIDTGTKDVISLSIAVGAEDRITQSDESAKQALELALGRGGDQAIVKHGSNYDFYGGKHQLSSSQSRVKTRLFSKALHQLFIGGGDIFIMGHKNADMDCFGSALGIAVCAKTVGARPFIILDEVNETIEIVVQETQQDKNFANCIISPEQAERMMRPNSILVIVDTQRPVTTCAPGLITSVSKLVLVDHHRRSADFIDNSTLHLLESRASSASELITEVLQYFDDNIRIPTFICSALLAGITVDTKHFAFNVGSRTFEAAGYLRKNGADIGTVKQMFRDDMDSYTACADAVRNAEILPGGVALSRCDLPSTTQENEKLIAAKVADQLINIRGIEAGFALGRDDNCTNVSGRSLGSINVQMICERLGGGGHLTMSGAQLQMGLDEAYNLVKKTIVEYVKETQSK